MPKQITAFAGLFLENGLLRSTDPPVSVQADQTSAKRFRGVIDVGVTEEVLNFGDVMSPRWVQFTNLDPVNKVQIGVESGGVMVPMWDPGPGEFVEGPLIAGAIVRAKAIGGTVGLDAHVLDE